MEPVRKTMSGDDHGTELFVAAMEAAAILNRDVPGSIGVRATHPITGWALDVLLVLDAETPGVLAHVLASGPQRRQVVFAYLSTLLKTERLPKGMARDEMKAWWRTNRRQIPASVLKTAGPIVLSRRSRWIMQHAFGSCPRGFLGALEKVGPDAEPVPFYRMLWSTFSDKARWREARCVSHEVKVNFSNLLVLRRLGPGIVFPGILDRFDTHLVDRFTDVLDLIRREVPGANDAALRETLSTASSLSNFLRLWLRQFPVRYPLPYPGTVDVVGVNSLIELEKASKTYKNCMGRYLLRTLRGFSAFYIIKDHGGLIIYLRKSSAGGWTVSSLTGPGNVDPTPEALQVARRWMAEHGLSTAEEFAVRDPWISLGRMLPNQYRASDDPDEFYF